jgi:hypothetical protein
MVLHARPEEVLDATDFHHGISTWCVADSGQKFGDCAFHLHLVLSGRGLNIMVDFAHSFTRGSEAKASRGLEARPPKVQ